MPRSPSRTMRRLAVGVVVGAAAFAVVDALRPRPGPARIVDWDEIRRRAIDRLGDSQTRHDAGDRRALEAGYARLAAPLEGPLLAFVGGGAGELPAFQALDRQGWIELNLGIMRETLEPLVSAQERLSNSRAMELGRGVIDRYVGLILGFLSTRVLGQYDPQLLGHEPAAAPGLYLVEPNIVEWEEEAGLPGEELRRWLILHEMTHAWQFGAHPWLREHLNGMLREVLGAAAGGPGRSLESLLALVVGNRGQASILNRIQATMSLIEGYSNLAMDVVGRDVLPDFERLEAAHRARAGEKTAFERLFWKLTGLELKLQQYVVGEKFCAWIHEHHGMEALNRAWTGPETLPALPELKDPALWMARMERQTGR